MMRNRHFSFFAAAVLAAGRTILSLLLLCLCTATAYAKGGAAHIQDALRISLDSNAKSDTPLWEMMSYISQGMDYGKRSGGEGIADAGSSFLKSIRAEFKAEGYTSLGGLGQHHYYGHWDFNGAIPEEWLKTVEDMVKDGKLPADARERFILRWRQFVFSRTQAVKQVFNLHVEGSDKVARSFASLVDDIHNLGDWAFDKDVAGLRSVDEIVNNYLKSSNRILGKHNNLVMTIKQEIKALPKMAPKEQAQSVIKILESHSGEMSERLYRIFARYGYNGEIKAIDYAVIIKETSKLDTARAVALAADDQVDDLVRGMSVGRVFKTNPVAQAYERNVVKASEKIANRLNGALERQLTQDQRLAKSLAAKGCAEVKTTTGILQTIALKDGTKVKVLHVPAENVAKGINAGVAAGVMTFIISEAVTGYCFFEGEISKDQFIVESAKNCAEAILTGGATFVAVALGATPGGPIVLAIGIGTYMLCDITFKRIERAIDYSRFHIEDMLGQFPVEFQRRRSTLEYTGYENLLSYSGHDAAIEFKGNGPSTLEFRGGDESLLEYKGRGKSLLESTSRN